MDYFQQLHRRQKKWSGRGNRTPCALLYHYANHGLSHKKVLRSFANNLKTRFCGQPFCIKFFFDLTSFPDYLIMRKLFLSQLNLMPIRYRLRVSCSDKPCDIEGFQVWIKVPRTLGVLALSEIWPKCMYVSYILRFCQTSFPNGFCLLAWGFACSFLIPHIATIEKLWEKIKKRRFTFIIF
jgi:hypothetical protein